MKQFYFKVALVASLALTTYSEAQTYIINSSDRFDCGRSNVSDIDHEFICVTPGNTVDLGTFTDTTTGGGTLASMNLKIYSTCDGEYAVILNGDSLGLRGVTSGAACNCSTIASDPNSTNNHPVSLTPAIMNSYVVGGVNTLSVNAINVGTGGNTDLCFYGAEVTVTINSTALSTEDVELNSVKVSPNPTSDYITVTGLKDTGNYKIYDVLGTEIHRGAITDKGEIEVKDFSNGVYFLKFDNEYTVRFIKKN